MAQLVRSIGKWSALQLLALTMAAGEDFMNERVIFDECTARAYEFVVKVNLKLCRWAINGIPSNLLLEGCYSIMYVIDYSPCKDSTVNSL